VKKLLDTRRDDHFVVPFAIAVSQGWSFLQNERKPSVEYVRPLRQPRRMEKNQRSSLRREPTLRELKEQNMKEIILGECQSLYPCAQLGVPGAVFDSGTGPYYKLS